MPYAIPPTHHPDFPDLAQLTEHEFHVAVLWRTNVAKSTKSTTQPLEGFDVGHWMTVDQYTWTANEITAVAGPPVQIPPDKYVQGIISATVLFHIRHNASGRTKTVMTGLPGILVGKDTDDLGPRQASHRIAAQLGHWAEKTIRHTHSPVANNS